MKQLLEIPHRKKDGLCPVNGIRNLIHWRTGRDWSNELVHGLGQGAGFAYLRFGLADPPRQVYWGIASPRQHKYLAELLYAYYTEIENRSFKFAWGKAREAVDNGTPPILGPLDMYHLHYYQMIYHQRHIPIHYLLLVGYDDRVAYVLDTGCEEVQKLPLDDLEQAWDVNVPGLGKRNRLAILDIPNQLAPTDELIRRSIADQCMTMLQPPVSMIGIPAMKKLAREVSGWQSELGMDVAARCLQQVREYLNSPPDLMGNHLTAGRDIYITFLEEAGIMAHLDLSGAIDMFRVAITMIRQIAQAIQQDQLNEAASFIAQIAEIEKTAFSLLLSTIGESS